MKDSLEIPVEKRWRKYNLTALKFEFACLLKYKPITGTITLFVVLKMCSKLRDKEYQLK